MKRDNLPLLLKQFSYKVGPDESLSAGNDCKFLRSHNASE
jgi:hypothetical protein